jgi:probable F420-dependent oxidoreductase
MKFGAAYSLSALDDAVAIRDFAQALDGAGFDFVTTAGHLLSAPAGRYPERPLPTYAGPFYDPFVLFGFLAGVTQRIRFRTSILILPLYPTALVAKQAAQLDTLSGGRFELGVGISWNEGEYAALGQDFRSRGRRLEEQISVLRGLWQEPFLTYEGRWHRFDAVGLNRLPAGKIPIWIGSGTDDRVLRRVAKLADGWIAQGDPTEPMTRLRTYLAEYGRDPASFGLTARVVAGPEGTGIWIDTAQRLQRLGATHLGIGAPPDLAPAAALTQILEAKRVLASELGS